MSGSLRIQWRTRRAAERIATDFITRLPSIYNVTMRIISVVGARPQFVKLAPIAAAMKDRADHVIVHTGQHYDELMSDVFFRDLGIPEADYNLGVGSGKHGAQTGAMMSGLEEIFETALPDCVLVYGDTNSTLAAAITAVKMHVPVAHLEAGLRSFNRRMPEEHNRVLTDHSSDLLLAPTLTAVQHLSREGLKHRTVLVGDVMTDVLYQVRDRMAAVNEGLPNAVTDGNYYVSTIHRPDNTDAPKRLGTILDSLTLLDKPVLLLAHPRLINIAQQHGINLERENVQLSLPLPYPQLVNVVQHSAGVITDSGGLQKEAFLLRIPCTTIRSETEWTETLDGDWNVLVDEDMSALTRAVGRPKPLPTAATPYGDGRAAEKVVDSLLSSFSLG